MTAVGFLDEVPGRRFDVARELAPTCTIALCWAFQLVLNLCVCPV